jgi:glucose/arabinose dehydrogenase
VPASGTGAVLPPAAAQAEGAASESGAAVEVLAENLRVPWAVAFLPDGDMLVTERPGTLLRIGADEQEHEIAGVRQRGEGGLLGVAVHPDFARNGFIYLYLTTAEDGSVTNRVERYRLGGAALADETEILAGIPGSANHDGGRLAFGPDGKLYVTTGDAEQSEHAPDKDSLAGKILRLNDDGSIPADNPFGNAVWSYGHRNPQGLAWDDGGTLWATEHGRSVPLSGYDELNRIRKGANYGWPDSQGDEAAPGTQPPVLHSGADGTWAPASLAFLDGALWFGGLKGEALFRVDDPGGRPALAAELAGKYGRIREVVAHGGFLYVTTSNTDGRGRVGANDDLLLKIDPTQL